MRLTEEEQALIVEHLHVAQEEASRLDSGILDRSERISAGYYALCMAVRGWTGQGPFAAYARSVARHEIIREIGRQRRRRGMGGIEVEPWRVYNSEALEAGELAARYVARLPSLTGRQREVLVLYMDGLSWADIARRLGIARTSVERLRREAAARLLA